MSYESAASAVNKASVYLNDIFRANKRIHARLPEPMIQAALFFITIFTMFPSLRLLLSIVKFILFY